MGIHAIRVRSSQLPGLQHGGEGVALLLVVMGDGIPSPSPDTSIYATAVRGLLQVVSATSPKTVAPML